MSNGFVHSVKVPRIYKLTADIVRRVREDGASLKSLIYETKHPNVSGIYGLSMNTLQMLPVLDQLLQKTQILTEQPRLDFWLARVLITELLWGKKCLRNNSKPVLTVLTYEDKLQEELKNFKHIETLISNKKKVQKPRYVRVNTLMLSVEKAISIFQEEGWKLLSRSTTYSSYLQSLSQLCEPYFIQDLHIPEILAFPSSTSFYQHPGYQSGELILQDKASCLPVHLLNLVSGSTVLDMCAAPGMKATYVAAKLHNLGTVYAVEIDTKRFETLRSQIETTHAFCVKPIKQDALTLDPKQYFDVEYILVDPSCSGSGIIDRPIQNNMDDKSESERLQNLQSFQVYLLRYALFNFPNVKKIIYSTCSLHPEENEEVIDEVLADIGDAYYLVPAKQLLNDWTNFSSQEYNCKDKCLYSKPNVDFCNGFFVAVFERNFEVNLPKCKRKGGNANPTEASVAKDEMIKEVAHAQKKYKKNKKNKEEISIDQEIKISEDIVESEAFEIKHTVKTKKRKKVEKNEKIALDESENIQKEPLKDKDTKKSKKRKKSKHENILQIVEEKKIVKVCDYGEKKQNEENRTKPLEKKRKKNKEIKIDEIYIQENK